MGSSSLMRLAVTKALAAAAFVVAGTGLAQDEVPVTYDEELAAGMPSYDDEEAAGPLEYDDDLAAGPEIESSTSDSGPVAASGAAGDRTLLGWDEGAGASSAPDRAGRKPWEWGADEKSVNRPLRSVQVSSMTNSQPALRFTTGLRVTCRTTPGSNQ